jgi:hypothetical protein
VSTVERHDTHGRLMLPRVAEDRHDRTITGGLAALGKTPETVTVDDLSPADEFHIGG